MVVRLLLQLRIPEEVYRALDAKQAEENEDNLEDLEEEDDDDDDFMVRDEL